ncbi:MAG: RNA degradosome polyphosphate kinase, partial [Acidimicrobiales bacterium]
MALELVPDPDPGPRYLNRDLSELDLSARILDLAEDPDVALLERVKFLAIFSTQIDTLFQVRVAALQDQVAAGLRARSPDGRSPLEQLRAIRDKVEGLLDREAHIFLDQVVVDLAAAGIRLSSWTALDDDDRAFLVDVFYQRIFPVLTPLAVDPGHPFPYISNLSLNLAVTVVDQVSGERRFARVKVPPLLPRFVVLPDGERFVPLEQLIAAHLSSLFPDMEIVGHHSFRVTRNADLTPEEGEA